MVKPATLALQRRGGQLDYRRPPSGRRRPADAASGITWSAATFWPACLGRLTVAYISDGGRNDDSQIG